MTTIEIYGRLLEHAAGGVHDGHVRTAAGLPAALPLRRWLAPAAPADLLVVERAAAPVLDVGCGPGRMLAALEAHGRAATGIDVSPVAVRLAQRRGHALRASVFSPRVPVAAWASVLLLDGNIGIGGRPEALLARARDLIAADGAVLVEAAPPGRPTRRERVRLETRGAMSPWFGWATVGIDGIAPLARAAGLRCAEVLTCDGRWFARLERPR